MHKEKCSHRETRLQIINEWADKGVQEPRTLFSTEKRFRELTQSCPALFKPVRLLADDDVNFQREVSYLIDAFDMLPSRPNIAFDSAWKAFELETKVHYSGTNAARITDRLAHYASLIDPDLIGILAAGIPMQACEHLFKVLITNMVRHHTSRANSRITTLCKNNSNASIFIDYLRSRYVNDTSSERRKGAALIRKALQGEELTLGIHKHFTLNATSCSQILILLYLWTIRNERYHGDSFSPFISSAAKVRTYAAIFYAFIVTYFFILWFWINKRPQVILGNMDTIRHSIDENLDVAKKLFKTHWDK